MTLLGFRDDKKHYYCYPEPGPEKCHAEFISASLSGSPISVSHYIPKPLNLFIQILLSKKRGLI